MSKGADSNFTQRSTVNLGIALVVVLLILVAVYSVYRNRSGASYLPNATDAALGYGDDFDLVGTANLDGNHQAPTSLPTLHAYYNVGTNTGELDLIQKQFLGDSNIFTGKITSAKYISNSAATYYVFSGTANQAGIKSFWCTFTPSNPSANCFFQSGENFSPSASNVRTWSYYLDSSTVKFSRTSKLPVSIQASPTPAAK